MKTLAIVQARMGSMRLPRKVMRDVGGVSVIELLLSRLVRSKEVDQIVVATTGDHQDQSLVQFVQSLGFSTFVGSKNDVLDRYYRAAKLFDGEIIIRITGDCPLVDVDLVDEAVREYRTSEVDYLCNTNPPSFPDGLDIEVFSFAALMKAFNEASKLFDREHVTPYIRNSPNFSKKNILADSDYSSLRWTIDETEDLDVVGTIVRHFAPNRLFSWKAALELYDSGLPTLKQNVGIKRNGGASMGSGQKLWNRAKKVIPGGNMLLSKRAEMFLPDLWPSYFSKAKGCHVWDLDGNRYIDMSIMGIGTNTLGYGDDDVDDAVRGVVDRGNMSTLNCPEEVYLAEKLIELHPWADMVKFARSGGEANAIAIRIARAASGKSVVAFCGYHGWHDWYLAANLGSSEQLAGHLLPGLEPNGVPQELQGTAIPFSYNRLDELTTILETFEVGVIKMEVSRNFGPEPGFLEGVRQLATAYGAVLIFDECTSGFRQSFGGLHKIYGVEPDMAMFGKALGNGYAITATIGRREVMEAAQTSFISSTFWTERIGPTAGLKTLEVMEQLKSWEIITNLGVKVQQEWLRLAKAHGLNINVAGLPALSTFSFSGENSMFYKTLITQEMLKRGYLASTSLYLCTKHTDEILEAYLSNLDELFRTIRQCEDGLDVTALLDGPIAHDGFRRLN